MQYVRITAEPVDGAEDAWPVHIDAILDNQANIAGDHDLFGVVGVLGHRENAYYPLALYPNGVLDYGSECDPTERYANFDLRDGRIELRRLVTIESHANGIQRFRIVEIRPLG